MKKEFRQTAHAMSSITYHICFCTRYRRSIFGIHGVKERVEELAREKAKTIDCEITEFRCSGCTVTMKVDATPEISAEQIVYAIKSATSLPIRKEFSALSSMSNLWTRRYMVSCEDLTLKEIADFERKQERRPGEKPNTSK